MKSDHFLVLLGLLLFLGFAAEQIFRRLRVPPVLILMGCGLLLGPIYRLLPAESFLAVAPHFGALAFLLILFEGGLDLDLDRVLGAARTAAALAVLGFALCLTAVMLAALAFGWPWRDALLLGTVLAPLSGAILIPLAARLEIAPELRAVLVLEAALADVLGVLGMGAAVQAVDVGGLQTLLGFASLLGALLSVLAGGLAGWLWPRALRSLGEHDYADVLTFGVALTLWGTLAAIGASGALAVLSFGFTLANLDEIQRALGLRGPAATAERGSATLHSFIGQTTFVVRTFFFVFLGVVIRIDTIGARTLALGATAMLAFFVVRRLLVPRLLQAPAEAPLLVWLQPRGLVTAVLAIEAAEMGLARAAEILPVASVVILASNAAMGIGLATRRAPAPSPQVFTE